MTSNFSTNTSNTNLHSNDEVYELTGPDGKLVKYDMSRLHFSEVAPEKIPSNVQTGPPMVNHRINIQDKRADGRLQDLLIRVDGFTFGVSESLDRITGALNGYTLPLSLWNQDGATPTQKYFTNLIEVEILTAVKEHLVRVGKSFGQPDLDVRDLRKMKIFYRPKDSDASAHPTWYPKLIVSKNKGMKIITRFYLMDENGNSCVDQEGNPIELDPLRLLKRMGRVKAVVKIESIYIRSEGCSVQVKVWEADYYPVESALPRKAPVNRSNATVVATDDSNPHAMLMLSNKSRNETSTEEVDDESIPSYDEATDDSKNSAMSVLSGPASTSSSSTSSASTGGDTTVVRRVVKRPVVKKIAGDT